MSEPIEPNVTKLISEEAATEVRQVARAQAAALAQLTPALRAVFEDEQSYYKTNTERSIRYLWERGQVFARVEQNRSLDRDDLAVDYGLNSVDLLATALGIPKDRAYRLRTFHSMYNSHELTVLSDTANDKDYALGWGVIQEAMGVPVHPTDPHKYRRDIIDLAVECKMSVRAVRVEIATRFPQSTRSKKTKSLPKAIKVLCNQADKFAQMLDDQVATIFVNISSGADITPQEWQDVSNRLSGVVSRVQHSVQRVNEYLTASSTTAPRFPSLEPVPA